MVLTEQKKVLTDITSEVRQVKLSLETVRKEQAKQNNAFEELMTTVKESAESIDAKFKFVMAMFVLVVIVIVVLAVTLRSCV